MSSDDQPNSFQAWLAAMPVEDVQQRIRELESELEVLRVLQRQRADNTGQAKRASTQVPHGGGQSGPRRRLSPQRRAIVELVRQNPAGVAPADIANGLNISVNAAQTSLSRMVQAGQLQRHAQGLYRLPAHIPAEDILNGANLFDQPAWNADHEEVDQP